MAIKIDLVDGEGGELTREGWVRYRTAKVHGISTALSGHARIQAAYVELVASGVDINYAHPTITTAYLKSIAPQADDSTTVTFRLTYEEPDHRTVEVEYGTSAGQQEVDTTYSGAPVSVSYTYPADYPYDTSLQGKTVTQRGLLPMILPEATLIVRRHELLTVQEVVQVKRQYEGRVNSGPWGGDPNAKAWEWLCNSITSRMVHTGVRNVDGTWTRPGWQVTYEFLQRIGGTVGGWDQTVRFIDPVTGHAPSDLVSGTGYKGVLVYLPVNFDALGLFV